MFYIWFSFYNIVTYKQAKADSHKINHSGWWRRVVQIKCVLGPWSLTLGSKNYRSTSGNFDHKYFNTLKSDWTFDMELYLQGSGASISRKYFRWGNGTIRDTQSSSKSLGIGVSHPFHLKSFGRNGIRRAEATGFTPEPQEEKVVYKERWRNGPWLD